MTFPAVLYPEGPFIPVVEAGIIPLNRSVRNNHGSAGLNRPLFPAFFDLSDLSRKFGNVEFKNSLNFAWGKKKVASN